VKRCKS